MLAKILCGLGLFLSLTLALPAGDRPNILWLSCEDMSPHLGCYGVKEAVTPHLDKFATQGIRYRHASSVAGVCAPSRSAIITGLYPTTLGTQHMRSVVTLPDSVSPFPRYLRDAGYYCTNNVKQDYQFVCPKDVWDASSSSAHWQNRPDKSQPFFAVFNFTGTHESAIFQEKTYKKLTAGLSLHDRNQLVPTIPPYYPDTPLVREDWARYFDLVTAMDRWFSEKLAELEQAGEAENTIVFFWSDHGVGLPRAKRWLYESGTHVPLIIRIPGKCRIADQALPGSTSDQLVSLLDLGPTVLNLCSLPIPSHIQGRPFLGRNLPHERQYLFGVRDRMDERYDLIRSVKDHRFKYLRNDNPWKPYDQFLDYATQEATLREIRRVAKEGKLSSAAVRYMAPTKPREELYELEADPHELHNLADDPNHRDTLLRLREASLQWSRDTRDLGLINESEIIRREKQFGNRAAILHQPESPALILRLQYAADLACRPQADTDALLEIAQDPDPAVRWWGITGLGLRKQNSPAATALLRESLRDPAPCNQVAAAVSLHHLGQTDAALPILMQILKTGATSDRLQAIIALDEMNAAALPAKDLLKAALNPRPDSLFDGKYIVRVAEQALRGL